jgi:hypothetical protein
MFPGEVLAISKGVGYLSYGSPPTAVEIRIEKAYSCAATETERYWQSSWKVLVVRRSTNE